MTASEDRIVRLADKIRRFRSEGVDRTLSERDTKAVLVEPLLEIIGWAVGDPTQVSRGDRPIELPADYSLKIGRRVRVLVECKRLTLVSLLGDQQSKLLTLLPRHQRQVSQPLDNQLLMILAEIPTIVRACHVFCALS